jgi:hypothetical protein
LIHFFVESGNQLTKIKLQSTLSIIDKEFFSQHDRFILKQKSTFFFFNKIYCKKKLYFHTNLIDTTITIECYSNTGYQHASQHQTKKAKIGEESTTNYKNILYTITLI